MSANTKVALVTGAAQGIGRGIALRLAKDGFDVALVDLKVDKLNAVKKEVEALGRKCGGDLVGDAVGAGAVENVEGDAARRHDQLRPGRRRRRGRRGGRRRRG